MIYVFIFYFLKFIFTGKALTFAGPNSSKGLLHSWDFRYGRKKNVQPEKADFAMPSKSLPRRKNRYSSINCRSMEGTMHLSNLYVIEKRFHLFIRGKLPATCSGAKAILGIGFHSTEVWIKLIDPETYTSDYSDISDLHSDHEQLLQSDNPAGHKTMIVYIHEYRKPPNDFSGIFGSDSEFKMKFFTVPAVLVSTLWPNFFRTLYAGASAWYSLISYQVFFPEHNQFVLIEPSPPNFSKLLEVASEYPLVRLEDLPSGVYKAVVLGISVQSHLSEISLENDRSWRQNLRSFAFRIFFESIKSNLLAKSKLIPERLSSRLSYISTDLSSRRQLLRAIFRDQVSKMQAQMNSLLTRAFDEKDAILDSDYRIDFSRLPGFEKLYRPGKKFQVTIVKRKAVRRVINLNEVVDALQKNFIELNITIYDFDDLSLPDQVAIMDNTDLFISMHGAAMAQLVFMRPGTFVIELFPYGFRKYIYQNLARSVGVYYTYWQNSHKENTIFHWELVEAKKFTDWSKEKILSQPIDWFNMDSKNFWRNQDTKVEIEEILHLVTQVILHMKEPDKQNILLYMPYDQINNQIVGLKSACAVANMLDRTLVVPRIGYRTTGLSDPRAQIKYNPLEYNWHNFENYFDQKSLCKLPCKYLYLDNFFGLYPSWNIDVAMWTEMDPENNDEQQFKYYYTNILALRYRHANKISTFHTPKIAIQETLKKIDSRILALGAMFWYYDFGLKTKYPLENFIDYIRNDASDPIYLSIMKSIKPSKRILDQATGMRQAIYDLWALRSGEVPQNAPPIASIHLRRGDYYDKCKKELELVGAEYAKLFDSCILSDKKLANLINSISESDPKSLFYISTNDLSLKGSYVFDQPQSHSLLGDETYDFSSFSEYLNLELRKKIFFHSEIKETMIQKIESTRNENSPKNFMDPADEILIDQWICTISDKFYGNHWSSFSRHVAEWRYITYGETDMVSWI